MDLKVRDLPLIEQNYKYTGETDEFHTKGNNYRVIEVGKHWLTGWGVGVWITNDEQQDAHNIDDCVFVGLDNFNKSFKK